MKDVFKELKVLGRKVALHKIKKKDVLETIFTSASTIVVTY